VLILLALLLQVGVDASTFDARKTAIRRLLADRDFSAAIERAKTLNREWPDDIAAYQLLAEGHLGMGDYPDAERAIQWMLDLRIGKADFQGWLILSRFREAVGDTEGALDAVNMASVQLAAEDQSRRSHLLLYAAHLQLLAGRLELAERALQAAGSTNDPLRIETLLRLRGAQGKRAEALRIVRGQEGALHPRQLFLLAEVSRDPGRYTAFEKAAREIMKTTDNANVELALYYAGTGNRPSEALRIARAESARRHDVSTMCALAVALFANRQTMEAKSTMRNVLAVGTRHPEILRHANRMGVKPR